MADVLDAVAGAAGMISHVRKPRRPYGPRRPYAITPAEALTRTSKPTGNMNAPRLRAEEVRQIRRLTREYAWPLSWCSYAFCILENAVVHILEGRSYKKVRREWAGPIPWEEIAAKRKDKSNDRRTE